MLFQNALRRTTTSAPLVLAFAVVLGALWAIGSRKAVQVRHRPVADRRRSTIVGEIGVARGDGLVFVHGELWQARSRRRPSCAPASRSRSRVEVEGLVLGGSPSLSR